MAHLVTQQPLLGNYKLVTIKLAVKITIRQLLIHYHCASKFEAPGHASTSPGVSSLGVPNYKFRTKLWLVGY